MSLTQTQPVDTLDVKFIIGALMCPNTD